MDGELFIPTSKPDPMCAMARSGPHLSLKTTFANIYAVLCFPPPDGLAGIPLLLHLFLYRSRARVDRFSVVGTNPVLYPLAFSLSGESNGRPPRPALSHPSLCSKDGSTPVGALLSAGICGSMVYWRSHQASSGVLETHRDTLQPCTTHHLGAAAAAAYVTTREACRRWHCAACGT